MSTRDENPTSFSRGSVNNTKGRLIVIDGSDGSGKQTQAELLKNSLEKHGKKVSFFDFPVYESFYGKMVAKYLRGEFGKLNEVSPHFAAILYANDRLTQRDSMISALARGEIVLCNRYVQSNLCYQAARVAAEKRAEFIAWDEEMEYNVNKLPTPDLVIFLDVPVEIGQKLVDQKGAREYVHGRDLHEQDTAYLLEVHTMYTLLAKERGWKVISCMKNNKLASREDIHSAILHSV